MSRFHPNFLIPLLAAGLTACWPFAKETPPVPPQPHADPNAPLTIVRPTEESDPRLAWISELIQPRFGQDRQGLFDGSLADGLRPRAPELPRVTFSTDGQARLKTPDLASWLSAETPQGALRLSLQPVPAGMTPTDARAAWVRSLTTFLAGTKAPKLFKIRFEADWLPARTAGPLQLPAIVIVQNPYREPLYREACRYLNGWVQARLLLAPAGPRTETTRPVTLRCVFSWSEEPLPTSALSLARFPIPLTMSDAIYFPFKTVDDALSSSVWQSLRIAKP